MQTDVALTRCVQGLAKLIGSRLNAEMGTIGRVLQGRYHAHICKTALRGLPQKLHTAANLALLRTVKTFGHSRNLFRHIAHCCKTCAKSIFLVRNYLKQ